MQREEKRRKWEGGVGEGKGRDGTGEKRGKGREVREKGKTLWICSIPSYSTGIIKRIIEYV